MTTILNYLQEKKKQFNNQIEHFFTGHAERGQDHHDPLLDVVRQYPDEAIWFIRVVMAFGSASGIVVSIPCVIFLALNWNSCGQCNRPLRYWVVFHCILQCIQAPVRMMFYFRLSAISRRQVGEVRDCVRALTNSPAWRSSKTVSIVTYGWFILGVVWILNSTHCTECPGLYRLSVAVTFTAVARLVVTLICFYHSFPPRFRAEPLPPKPRGATQAVIDKLETLTFSPNLFQDDDASCAVCLSEFAEGDLIRALPCHHCFHKPCIDKWLKKNKVCPLCLQDIEESDGSKISFQALRATRLPSTTDMPTDSPITTTTAGGDTRSPTAETTREESDFNHLHQE